MAAYDIKIPVPAAQLVEHLLFSRLVLHADHVLEPVKAAHVSRPDLGQVAAFRVFVKYIVKSACIIVARQVF